MTIPVLRLVIIGLCFGKRVWSAHKPMESILFILNSPSISLSSICWLGPLDMNFGCLIWMMPPNAQKLEHSNGEAELQLSAEYGFVCFVRCSEEYETLKCLISLVVWRQTLNEYKVLSGEIDKYLSVARRADNVLDSFSLTNRSGWTIDINLNPFARIHGLYISGWGELSLFNKEA